MSEIMSEDAAAAPTQLRIALVAHDSQKPSMIEWSRRHKDVLARHLLWGTGTTGGQVADRVGLDVTRLKSGPLGGDQQLGAMIAEGRIDMLVFFTDPLVALPHDVDVKALLRVSVLYDVVVACNAATADALIHSRLFDAGYRPRAD
ncbi:MAG: methylglyoxal synthase [Pseudomonadota bacterium]